MRSLTVTLQIKNDGEVLSCGAVYCVVCVRWFNLLKLSFDENFK